MACQTERDMMDIPTCLLIIFHNTLWMSKRRLMYVIDVSNMTFVRYECLKDVFCMLQMSERRLLYVIDVSKIFCTL